MPTALVVGASRGIGLGLASQYLDDGWRVHATTRTPREPGALGMLQGDLVVHELDVCNGAHIAGCAAALAGEGIDVLIHNAGVSDRGMTRDEVMDINAHAPIVVVQAFLESLRRGRQRKILLMSSQVGARHGRRRSLGVYGDSKAALNDRFRELAPAWGEEGIIAVVMHPGWVQTDMGGRGAPLTVQESVTGIRRVLARLTTRHHGRFWTWDGREHPW